MQTTGCKQQPGQIQNDALGKECVCWFDAEWAPLSHYIKPHASEGQIQMMYHTSASNFDVMGHHLYAQISYLVRPLQLFGNLLLLRLSMVYPRPDPDFFPPPSSLFTVAQARRLASFSLRPRSS